MKVLVINSGSSSLKYQLIDMETEGVIAKGTCERIGIQGANLKHTANGKDFIFEQPMPTHNEAVALVLNALTTGESSVIKSMEEIDAVGHRAVASGEVFKQTTLVTDETIAKLEALSDLAPLHNPAAVIGVKACRAAMPNTPMAFVFDTSFHFTMPEYAYMYAINYEDYENYKVRRYGFHGTSHKYVAQEAAKYICDLKIISIQQIDQDKMNKDINDYRKHIADLDADINDIDKVVLRELDKLKVFYKPRMLKLE